MSTISNSFIQSINKHLLLQFSVCGLFIHSKTDDCWFSGRAIKHVKESIFSLEAGARRGIPKVLVVLTDGRSQDDVNKVSKEMQMDGGVFLSQILISHTKKKSIHIINYLWKGCGLNNVNIV